MRILTIIAALASVLLAGQAAAQATFSDTTTTGIDPRGIGNPLVAIITVSAPYQVVGIATPNLVATPSNQKFVIYDTTTNTAVYVSPAKAFPADAGVATLKASDPFPAVTLLPLHTYYIGSISDQPTTYSFRAPGAAFTLGVVTNGNSNGNLINFATPVPFGSGLVSAPIVLTSVAAATAVPTMSEWAMILFGTILAGGAALYIRRRGRFV